MSFHENNPSNVTYLDEWRDRGQQSTDGELIDTTTDPGMLLSDEYDRLTQHDSGPGFESQDQSGIARQTAGTVLTEEERIVRRGLVEKEKKLARSPTRRMLRRLARTAFNSDAR